MKPGDGFQIKVLLLFFLVCSWGSLPVWCIYLPCIRLYLCSKLVLSLITTGGSAHRSVIFIGSSKEWSSLNWEGKHTEKNKGSSNDYLFMHATVQQLHRRISKQSKKSVSSKVKWWYDRPISTWQKQTGITSVCTRFSTVLDSTSKHCMLTQIMHHPQAKKLSRREMLKRAKQRYSGGAHRVHPRPVPREARSQAGTTRAVPNFLGTTAWHYPIAQ